MAYVTDFFISHRSKDSDQAYALESLLRRINPEWNIFLDCCDEKPLEQHKEWLPEIANRIMNSRFLIFVASSPDYLKKGHGWLYEEVSTFYKQQVTNRRDNRHDLNQAYFGIFFGAFDLTKELFGDPERGAEYRIMYESVEHLMLDAGESIYSAQERIKKKVLNMSSQTFQLSSEIIDKAIAFAERKAQRDDMFRAEAIDQNLLPELYETDSDSKAAVRSPLFEEQSPIDFDQFCCTLSDTHAVILGEQGGSGKTSLMTKLFYHFLHGVQKDPAKSMIPIYVEAKALTGTNTLILRQIAATVYQEHTAMTDLATSSTVAKLSHEFSQKTASPRYLLLVDGYNEIPQKNIAEFNQELQEFHPDGKYPNVRVVVSSRFWNQENVPNASFYLVELGKLDQHAIFHYLEAQAALENDYALQGLKNLKRLISKAGIYSQRKTAALLSVLSSPIYLKLYAAAATDAPVFTRSDLLRAVVDHQEQKDRAAAANETQQAFISICLRFLLPRLAYELTLCQSTASQNVFTLKELASITTDAMAEITGNNYFEYYGREHISRMQTDITRMSSWQMADGFLEYFTKTCRFLQENDGGRYSFIHAVYQEFFCAQYLIEDIRRSLALNELNQSMACDPIPLDIRATIVESLGEKYPFISKSRWVYSCNDSSALIKLLDLARQFPEQANASYVANLVSLLRAARQYDLSGCDFSKLDLTKSNLQACIFSRQDPDAVHAADFRGATINSENLLCLKHFALPYTACINQQWLATLDRHGTLMIWDRHGRALAPHKILYHVNPGIKKVLFAEDGKAIYGMDNHSIVQIPIPDTYSSNANPQVLLKSAQRLRNIQLDDRGALLFTSSLNAFNPKPVSAPDLPDQRNFYKVNDYAAIRQDGNQIVYGYSANCHKFKLFNFDPESNTWTEQKLGFLKYLEAFMQELEQVLRETELYTYLLQYNDPTDPIATDQCDFLLSLQSRFEDRNHNHEKVLPIIIEKVTNKLLSLQIELSEDYHCKVTALCDKYSALIQDARNANPELFLIFGNPIYSVDYRPGTSILLIAYSKLKYGPNLRNKAYEHFLVELNTKTLETRQMIRSQGTRLSPFQAYYSQDNIILTTTAGISLCNLNGDRLMFVGYKDTSIRKLLPVEKERCVYGISTNFIYRFDERARCTGAWYNDLNDCNLMYGENTNRAYLVSQNQYVDSPDATWIKTLNLSTGQLRKIPNQLSFIDALPGSQDHPKVSAAFEDVKYKYSNGSIISYVHDVLTGETEIHYQLFICGCNFSGIQGTLSTPQNLQLLHQYGAITDADPVLQNTPPLKVDFSPSGVVFVPPVLVSRPPLVLACGKHPMFSNKPMIWDRIHTSLDAPGYSVLEWVNRLIYATPAMLTDLLYAKVITVPARDQETAAEQIERILKRNLKLKLIHTIGWLNRGKQCESYLVSASPYGKAVLGLPATGSHRRSETLTAAEIRDTLDRNQWFCITMHQFSQYVSGYALSTVFDNKHAFSARARVDCYIKLGELALFAEHVQNFTTNASKAELIDKVTRLCKILTHYPDISCSNWTKENLCYPPVMVLIGKNMGHCRAIHDLVQHIDPHIRIIYTYRKLLGSFSQHNFARYFEFIGNTPYEVDLTKLIEESMGTTPYI